MDQRENHWDVIVIGGGITGAGIFHETVRAGLKTVLVEQQDFAWGTSSRSSKLVHGGLRYLKEGRFLLTRDAVRERERLLRDAAGLVTPLGFLVPVYRDRGPGRWTLKAGLSLYDMIAKRRQHRFLGAEALVAHEPHIDRKKLVGGFEFCDAQVDDARLVLRLIFEGIFNGGVALNYTRVAAVTRDATGQVKGVTVKDATSRRTRVFSAPLVFNATGCWAERLHPSPVKETHLRPLRGSHLIFPAHVLPVCQAITFTHPEDGRAVFVVPWEGAVMAGTTDLDHDHDLNLEPRISEDEVTYLLEGLQALFPALEISARNCLATLAGVRPVLGRGKQNPSAESREHVVWVDKGLVTVTGGKLTTFRKLASDALAAARPFLPKELCLTEAASLFSPPAPRPVESPFLKNAAWQRLAGRYGRAASQMLERARPEELTLVPGTPILWAEIAHAAAHERIVHLSDLMLRRVRLGLLATNGGQAHLAQIRRLCAPHLHWDAARWKREISEYRSLWQYAHGLPGCHAASKGPVRNFSYPMARGLEQRGRQSTGGEGAGT